MLVHLRIRDFAIIDEVELALPPGFTVVTGETGAGKSILVDALSLALGGRASTDLVRTGADTAQVEALFDISQHPLVRARLEQRDLVGDDPDVLLVRRSVAAKGRGKVVINERLSTVATLGEIVRGLVDISGQHEQQSLLWVDGHLDILDAYAQNEALRADYREAYEALRRLRSQAQHLRQNEEALWRRADYLRFELDEIDSLAPRPGEDDELEAERRRLAHAEKLKGGSSSAEALLYGDDGSAFDKLGKASAEVEALARIDPELGGICEGLDVARREIEEAARVLQRYAEHIEAEPQRLEEVDGRLAQLRRLCRKHGGSIDDVLARRDAIREELETLEHTDASLAELDAEQRQREAQAVALAEQLHTSRTDAAKRLQRALKKELAEMELDGAVFRTAIRQGSAQGDGMVVAGSSLGPRGADDVEFLWSANRGEEPRPLAKIASGGELSRLMLAVKTVLASRDLVSLYVFDEVDSGLGGRAADSIGRKIQRVAHDHQAITITHLAPIAARADYHLRVTKHDAAGRTISRLEPVDGGARAEEIARMIDGAEITKATRQAAREMLARS